MTYYLDHAGTRYRLVIASKRDFHGMYLLTLWDGEEVRADAASLRTWRMA